MKQTPGFFPWVSSDRVRARREALWTAALVSCLIAVAWAFIAPWLPTPPAGGATLARYAPMPNGGALLIVYRGADGAVLGWESRNTRVLPLIAAIAELPLTQSLAIAAFLGYQPGGAVPSVLGDVIQVRVRRLAADGTTTDVTEYRVRDARGEFLIGRVDGAEGDGVTYSPPPLVVPADLTPGSTWDAVGRLSNGASYALRGRVATDEVHPAECVRVEVSLELTTATGASARAGERADYCPDTGLMALSDLDDTGSPSRSGQVLPRDRTITRPAPDTGPSLPPLLGGSDPGPGEPAGWTLQRVGRIQRGVAEGTASPTWIPTEPPLVLAAGYGGALAAFDARESSGRTAWRFHAAGTSYGAAGFDPRTGQLFVGATDKRLYALDARGLFLWSFKTGDNVVTRPLVVGDVVIFGSEDRGIYGLDAATGSLRWRVATGGGVVSSPALAAGLVVIGSDDGGVYTIDPASGTLKGLYTTSGPVEAPIVAAEGTAYAASRDGTVTALKPAACNAEVCEPLWVAAMAGSVFRSAPEVGAGRVFVVDEDGRLFALDAAEGRRLWDTPAGPYVGPPVLAREELIVAAEDGTVRRLSLDGVPTGQWSAVESAAIADRGMVPEFRLGPVPGGGALWLIDHRSVVWRLGPPTDGAAPLTLAWADDARTAPFDLGRGHALLHTALAHEGRLLTLDFGGHLYRIDPVTGRAELLGAHGDGAPPQVPEAVVAGDVLVAAAGSSLQATSLVDGRARWQVPAGAPTWQPATVAGDTILWIAPDQAGTSGLLHALDGETGAARWSTPVEGFFIPGGAVVHGGTAYVSTPPAAFDLATGQQRWRARPTGLAVGGPALSPPGETLYVGLVDATGTRGSFAAFDTDGGQTRWQVDLAGEVVDPLAQPAARDGVVIVPLLSGAVLALAADDGAVLWRHQPGRARWGAITVAGDRVWLALRNGEVRALDARTGALVARYSGADLDLTTYPLTSQRPTIVGQRVVVALGSVMVALEAPP